MQVQCAQDHQLIDGEHRLQIELIDGILAAIHSPHEHPAPTVLFEQLHTVCEAHFAGEELLMRLCSYYGHDAHAADHERTLERMQLLAAGLGETIERGEEALVTALQQLRAFLLQHMQTRDISFGEYYRRWSAGNAGGQIPA